MSGYEVPTITVDQHIQVLRDLLRADHEAWIAEVQSWADEAEATGDLEHVARLRAMTYPWEQSRVA